MSSGAISVEIEDSHRWKVGDVAILRNQEAKTLRFSGSLVFEQPLQNDYPAGTEVRTFLPSERIEEREGYRVIGLGLRTTFSLESVKLLTVDVVKRGEALANVERELITHFQWIS